MTPESNAKANQDNVGKVHTIRMKLEEYLKLCSSNAPDDEKAPIVCWFMKNGIENVTELLTFAESRMEELEAEISKLKVIRGPIDAELRDARAENKALNAKVAHLYDVYDSLGIKWGDDPFSTISKLRAELEKVKKELAVWGKKHSSETEDDKCPYCKITELRNDLEEAKKFEESFITLGKRTDGLVEENRLIRQKNESLRKALEKIAKHLSCNDEKVTVLDEMGFAEKVAKEALKRVGRDVK